MAQFLANQVAVEDHNIVHSQLQPLLSPAMLSCSHNAIVSYLWNCYLGAGGGGFPVDDDLYVVHAVVAAVAGTAIVPNLQSPIARLDFAAGRFSLTYAPEWLLERAHDIDEAPNAAQLASLATYDIVYLTGGDPIGFRRNILRAGLPARLRAMPRRSG